MQADFDEIVVGAGIAGAAAAYFLSGAGRKVAVVDAGASGGQGASRFSGGLVRAYDPDDVLAELSLSGTRVLQEWERLGIPGKSPLQRCGLLYVSRPERQAECEHAAESLALGGYPISSLSPRRRAQVFGCERPGYGGAWLYEPDAGVADVRLTVRALLSGAVARGAIVLEHCHVQAVEPGPGGPTVRLSGSALRAERVVVTAGIQAVSWFPALGLFARTIPLTCVRANRPVARVAVVDENASTYVRPLDGQFFWCGSQRTQRFDHGTTPEPYGDAHAADSLQRLVTLFGDAAPGAVVGGLMGWDCYSDDNRPRVGWVDSERQVYVAAGFSGRGFKYALPVGAAIASALAGRKSLPDDLAVRLERLAPPVGAARAPFASELAVSVGAP